MKGVADVFVEAGSIDSALGTYENAVNAGPAGRVAVRTSRSRARGSISPGPPLSCGAVFWGAETMSGLLIDDVSMRFDLPNGSVPSKP